MYSADDRLSNHVLQRPELHRDRSRPLYIGHSIAVPLSLRFCGQQEIRRERECQRNNLRIPPQRERARSNRRVGTALRDQSFGADGL